MALAALIIVATFVTSILSGIFGMAGGLILMGVFAGALPVVSAMALHGVTQFTSNAWRVILHRKHVVWGPLIYSTIGAVAAMLLFAVIAFSPSKFLIFIGIGLTPILLWLPERWIQLDASRPKHALVAGFSSTGLALISGASGPVTDIFFVRTRLTRHQVVATKAVIQATSHVSKIFVYGAALLSAESLRTVTLPVLGGAVLASMAGIMVGGYLLDRISDAHFQASRRWIVTVIGIAFLIQAAQIALAG